MAVVPSVRTASAERFEVTAGAEGNLVTFESKAMMETFHGKTHRVSGYLELNPGAIGDSVAVFLEVDLATLDTGIGLRNRHMRENHLETDRYPLAVFRGAAILRGGGSALTAGASARFFVAGTMELHGVIRPLQILVDVVLEGEDRRRLQVSTEFPITLAEYEIERPKFIVLKLGETQMVTVNLLAVSGAPERP
ncbi:MAG: YceI family protein [Candidatus Krumholzibacteria bacterium]|nr:YceI family protein [Candidatus Krumholzibacteria bacterium]